MDLTFSEQDRTFQQEVRTWLDDAWPQEMRDKQARSALGKLSKEDLVAWQKRLAEKGWAATNWPAEYGGAAFTPTQSYIFDAEISELDSLLEKKFNLVFTDNSSDTSILLLHGRGLHPTEPNVIDPLRIELSESNYNVFSLQLPVLAKGQTYYDYHKIFPYSDARIETAVKHINSSNIIIIAHSCGANMLLSFLENITLEGITGIVLISAGAVDKNQVILESFPDSLFYCLRL